MGTTLKSRTLNRAVKLFATHFALLLLYGCDACNGNSSNDADVDIFDGYDGVDSMLDVDVDGLDSLDIADSIISDSSDADVGEAQDCEFPGEGSLGLVAVPPSRPATDCGAQCRQVTFFEFNQCEEYEVDGDYLVASTCDIEGSSSTTRVWVVELSTLDAYMIDESVKDGAVGIWNADVAIHGSRVIHDVVCDGSSSVTRLYSVLIGSWEQELVREHTYLLGKRPMDIRVHGNNIVWWDNRTGDFGDGNFYILDTSAGDEDLISTSSCFKCGRSGVDIYNSSVVFQSDNRGSEILQLHHFNAISSATEQITTGAWDHCMPSIWENLVVWIDYRAGGNCINQQNGDVYMLDIETGVEQPVTNDLAAQLPPATIDDGKIAWIDCRNDTENPSDPSLATVFDIYVYDVVSGTESLVNTPSGMKGLPRISGSQIYFTMADSSGIWSVFEKTLE